MTRSQVSVARRVRIAAAMAVRTAIPTAAALAPVLLLATATAAAPGASGAAPPAPLHLGATFALEVETPIEEIVARPELFHNRLVRTSGVIASACDEEGCFIEVVPRQGGDGIVVNFPGLVHTFPVDCAGREAVVEGLLYRKIYHSARVSHWQHHSYHVGRHVPEFSLVLRLEAQAAEVAGSKAGVPPLPDIRAASPFAVDLDREEFEDEGLGIGKKRLEADVPRRQPGSAVARSLVVCLEGALSVTRDGAEPVRLAPGGMAYVPPRTPYLLQAEDGAPAQVLIVYANTPPQEKEHKHGPVSRRQERRY